MSKPKKDLTIYDQLQTFLDERAHWFQIPLTDQSSLASHLGELLANSPPSVPNSLADAIQTGYAAILQDLTPTPETESSSQFKSPEQIHPTWREISEN